LGSGIITKVFIKSKVFKNLYEYLLGTKAIYRSATERSTELTLKSEADGKE
jgi:hypothetical protein